MDWSAVRAFYIRTRSVKAAAEKHGLPLNTVKTRARREAWAKLEGSSGELAEPSEGSTGVHFEPCEGSNGHAQGSAEVHVEPSQGSNTAGQGSSKVHLEPSKGTRRVQAEPSESVPGFKIEPPLNPEAARAVAAGEPSEFHIPAGINEWDRLAAAKFYLQQLHWAVHHLFPPDKGEEKERGKRPWSKGWRQHTYADVTIEGLEEVFGRRLNNNLGVVMRPPFIAVDLDSKPDDGASVMAWLGQHPQLANVPRERTAGGVHLHFVCRDLPPHLLKVRQAPTVEINDKVTAELYVNGLNLVVAPSVHKSGHHYTWEVTGSLPQIRWADLNVLFGFEKPEEKRPVGRPPKDKPWWSAFEGDIPSLDILALFRTAELLGECINPEEGKWAVRCPWVQEHSGGLKAAVGTDTVVFAGEPPAFKCLHAHCVERSLRDVCAWFENRQPGVVDKYCGRRRVYKPGVQPPGQLPQVVLPGNGKNVKMFGRELGTLIGPSLRWFIFHKRVVQLHEAHEHDRNAEVQGVSFDDVSAAEMVSAVEDHADIGMIEKDKADDSVFVLRSMNEAQARLTLGAHEFRDRIPKIYRLLDVPVPILGKDNQLRWPKPGYDAEHLTWLTPNAPVLHPMSVDEALHWLLDELLTPEAQKGWCWSDDQSRTHALARVLSPMCRGLMGWRRTPLWIYHGNREGCGKDTLAATTFQIYMNRSVPGAPISKGNDDEMRKRITSSLLAGARFIHIANLKGHICFPSLEAATDDSGEWVDRLLCFNKQLNIANEAEFSLSVNNGTWEPDIERRARRICLHLVQEDGNGRDFRHTNIGEWISENRAHLLSAIATLVTHWVEQGCPPGPTRFSSFPQWSRVVGGVMHAAGLPDPCRPQNEETALAGDQTTDNMKRLCQLAHVSFGDRWVKKDELYDLIKDSSEVFNWLDLSEHASQVTLGKILLRHDRREFGGILFTVNRTSKNYVSYHFAPFQPGTSTADRESREYREYAPALPIELKNNCATGALPHFHDNYFSSACQEGKHIPDIPYIPSARVQTLVADRAMVAGIAAAIRQSGSVALDLETYGSGKGDGLDPWKGDIRLLSLCVPGGDPWLLDLRTIGYDLGELKDALEGCEITAHNAKFDLLWLRVKCGLLTTKVFCTLTTARLLTAGIRPGNNLDQCLERYCDIKPAADHSTSDWGGMVLTDAQLAYAARDVAHLYQLAAAQRELIIEARLDDVWQLEMRLLPAVVEIEASGIAVDLDRLKSLQHKHHTHALELAAQLRELLKQPGLNPSSPVQLTKALQAQGINIASTSEETLKAADDGTIIPAVLAFRAAEKQTQQADTLLSRVRTDGRIHGRFDPTGTATGRFSSKDPNLQNIGRGELRSCFIPAPGHKLVVADYSQIELRAAAAIAGETRMIEAYKRREDLHRQTAAAVLGKPLAEVTNADRQTGKAVSFGLLFGQSAPGLVRYAASSYGVTLELEQANQIRRQFFHTYGALRQWHGESRNKAEAGAREARTVMGRRRVIPPDATEWDRFTALVNTPVQGSCADGMKRAIVRLHHELPIEARIVSTVHDELLIEAPENMAAAVCDQVNQVMCEAMSELFPTVPIEVEAHVCDNWGEK